MGSSPLHTVVSKGPRLKGKLLPGSGDAALVDANDVLRLDLRLTFQTDYGALIYLQGNGVMHADIAGVPPPEQIEQIMRRGARGHPRPVGFHPGLS